MMGVDLSLRRRIPQPTDAILAELDELEQYLTGDSAGGCGRSVVA